MAVNSTLFFFFINFKPWLSLGFAQFIFSVTLHCLIFFPSLFQWSVLQSYVLNPGCCPRLRWSHVLLNRRPTAPVYRHFVKSTAPRSLHAIKIALNPGFGRVNSPLCPGVRGAGVSTDWCIKEPRHTRNCILMRAQKVRTQNKKSIKNLCPIKYIM